MSVPSHSTVIRAIVIPAIQAGGLLGAARRVGPNQCRGESRWKLHLRQIADSAVRGQAQGSRLAMGAILNTPLGR
jgi:hypothetical protein